MLKVLYNLLWAIAVSQGTALVVTVTTLFIILPIVLLASNEPVQTVKDLSVGIWCIGHVIGAGLFFISLDKTESLFRLKEKFIEGVQRGFKSINLSRS